MAHSELHSTGKSLKNISHSLVNYYNTEADMLVNLNCSLFNINELLKLMFFPLANKGHCTGISGLAEHKKSLCLC